jgi:hypothetical protein
MRNLPSLEIALIGSVEDGQGQQEILGRKTLTDFRFYAILITPKLIKRESLNGRT